ncbi:probable polygalacturonase [Impatiens glandulifera]|uniref:probable polygalacturonase n=1 Tax=Impatiens glandulifera TaxID=253017 RepID=UPI001FB0A932|nr:probable polygalacturonase [Impatiens glandulifera]
MVDIIPPSRRHRLHDIILSLPNFISTHKILISILWIIGFTSIFIWQQNNAHGFLNFRPANQREIPNLRPVVFNLTDFGGIGDGVKVNTEAFEMAVHAISKLVKNGGGQLNVMAGVWVTAPFNMTSHMTLFLAEGAVILGIDDEKQWPLMPPLPSYGMGRDHSGPRFGSLIHGQNLKDVVITGYNGSINGNGQTWWKKYRRRALNNTRGSLVQFMWSSGIIISNITLRDSPFWTLHPYDCINVTIKNVTILAPIFEAPNINGIDPDSCEDVVIEDCYISVGDDGIAIKSGWDRFGIAYGRPSKNILIRNLVVSSMRSAGVSIGSEMSGGVSNVTIENVLVWSSRRGVRIKTTPGRGGYIRKIVYRNLTFENVRVGIHIKAEYNEHPEENYDRKAFPIIEDITYTSVHGKGVRVPIRIHGAENIPIKNVTFRDISIESTPHKRNHTFQCGYVRGKVIGIVFPRPCENLDLYDEQNRLVKISESEDVTDIDYDL